MIDQNIRKQIVLAFAEMKDCFNQEAQEKIEVMKMEVLSMPMMRVFTYRSSTDRCEAGTIAIVSAEDPASAAYEVNYLLQRNGSSEVVNPEDMVEYIVGGEAGLGSALILNFKNTKP